MEKFTIKGSFKILEDKCCYELPEYQVIPGVGLAEQEDSLVVCFVRGNKEEEKDTDTQGVIHEDLLSMMIHDLRRKNEELPNRHTSVAITKLEEALHRLWARSIDRQKRGVQATYKK